MSTSFGLDKANHVAKSPSQLSQVSPIRQRVSLAQLVNCFHLCGQFFNWWMRFFLRSGHSHNHRANKFLVENHGLDVFTLPAFRVKEIRTISDPLSNYFILIPLLCQSFDIHQAIRISLFLSHGFREARTPFKLNSYRVDRAVMSACEPLCHYPYKLKIQILRSTDLFAQSQSAQAHRRTTEDAALELRNEEKNDSGHHAGRLVLDRVQPVCQRTAILI